MAEQIHNVKGMRELSELTRELPYALRNGILRAAFRAGAKPVAEQVKANSGDDTGEMDKSVRVRVDVRGLDEVVARVLIGSSKRAFYPHMVEWGTAAHLILPDKAKALVVKGRPVERVEHPGSAPRPFAAPALDSEAVTATRTIAEVMKRRLSRIKSLPELRASARDVGIDPPEEGDE